MPSVNGREHMDINSADHSLLPLRNPNQGVLEHTINVTVGIVEKEATKEKKSTTNRRSKNIRRLIATRFVQSVLFCGYLVYVGFSIHLNPRKSVLICVVTPFIIYVVVNKWCHGRLRRAINKAWRRLRSGFRLGRSTAIRVRRIATGCCVIGIAVFLIVDIWDNTTKWRSLGGLALLIAVSAIGSQNRRKIIWTPVIWGVILQFILGLLILRWRLGFVACQWLGSQVTSFFAYTDSASKFIFGVKYIYHPIVFKIMPMLVFYSASVSVLYYLGAMQVIIKAISVVLQYVMDTTPIEAFACAVHIFLGNVESSLTLKPFLPKLTLSELHAVMTSGFATVAGTMFAVYVEFGVRAEHIISASFMSAPAALAIAKLSIPETEVSRIKTQKEIAIPKGKEANVIEALSVGATAAIRMVAYVIFNLIAFIAAMNFLDSVLSYLGSTVGCPQLSVQLVCSYVFMPLAAAIGVPWGDAFRVGSLIGKKLLTSEFLAYIDMGVMHKDGLIEDRTAVLTTYMLCGFGSIASLGIIIGAMTAAAPTKTSEISNMALRSMINGNIACFMTACVAGLLYSDAREAISPTTVGNVTATNSTHNVTAVYNGTYNVTMM